MSNFSFYYAHHMTTVEGGMVCTNDEELYEILRMLRGHGMVREAVSPALKRRYKEQYSDLNPDFIFAYPAYNVRSTELNAVLGRSQLKRLDERNALRIRNLEVFLGNLDPAFYRTDFALEGSCNYAFTLVLKKPDPAVRDRLMEAMRRHGVEFRRGTSGGGNQLRQPFVRNRLGEQRLADYPEVEHVHFFGFYIGNYPELEPAKILQLCELLNRVAGE
jgi:CDP-6-deoxy-D-xylo-4-hexulose-3-dehydrase